ncbi:uncharacterized protein Z518_00124 [Rhinocladiella mackenziei CBS 650.93]|uniref:Enoyl-CoA hydratase n=1 Tax=Rhinocladiella mackenziei CBS 650.93 TaxID=1442369 RepID=A0A0D2J0A3_9EURO|nr:uncharacterized protein Z518_00124 [Rhinocladiella mackenziei CBS 650.93]KIX09046.1 hypothetical protein Z518_00124 [Rhinocladiella mackenziei CBS 650.93]
MTKQLNRPKQLNAFTTELIVELIEALRALNEHPKTVFTVLTGKGRFFSSGADVKGTGSPSLSTEWSSTAQKKVAYLGYFSSALELLRSMIDHKKVFVLALNGPAVGGGAAWFEGIADIVLAAQGVWLQIPFNALGLVPENGSSTLFAQTVGVHRANDFLMFGRKLTVEELKDWGMVNRVFPAEHFHDIVIQFLEQQLHINDGKSMMETKRLQNLPLRQKRMLAVYDSVDALAERFVEDAPKKRFEEKRKMLEAKSKTRSKL